MTISIMFVDESPHVLSAMKRIFRKMRHQRSLRFKTSPDEALKQLATEPADVLITAMSFSGQSGMELIKKVRMQFPQTVRIVLSGSVSSDVVLLDYPYLERLGLIGHLGKWRKTCLELLEQQP